MPHTTAIAAGPPVPAAHGGERAVAEQRPSTAPLADLRRATRHQVVHITGVDADGALLADLTSLTGIDLRRVHIWTAIDADARRRRGGALHVRFYAGVLTIWRYRYNRTGHPLTVPRADIPVTSVKEAVDVLVALGVLHPRWSSVLATMATPTEDPFECPACETVDDLCPFHSGVERGARRLACALLAIAEDPQLVDPHLASVASAIFGEAIRAATSRDLPAGQYLVCVARAIAEDPGSVSEPIRRAAMAVRDRTRAKRTEPNVS